MAEIPALKVWTGRPCQRKKKRKERGLSNPGGGGIELVLPWWFQTNNGVKLGRWKGVGSTASSFYAGEACEARTGWLVVQESVEGRRIFRASGFVSQEE